MTKLRTEISAALDMARSVGVSQTADRIINYAAARNYERQRQRRFKKLGLKGQITRSVLGSLMELDADKSGLDRDLLLDGIREPIATGHIMSLLRPDDIVLEVGANIGYYALLESKICNRIYAIEPHPENFARLQRNIALNDRNNIIGKQAAFGASAGPIKLYCSPLSNWHSCRDVPDSDDHFVEVGGYTIDTFADEHETPTFVKMDVEGYELEVLRGAERVLGKIKHLFIELHGTILAPPEIREVLERIDAAGLKPTLISQYDRPGMARTYAVEQLEQIRQGDRGTFELFFSR